MVCALLPFDQPTGSSGASHRSDVDEVAHAKGHEACNSNATGLVPVTCPGGSIP